MSPSEPSTSTRTGEKRSKKRKFRSDGSGIWQRPVIDGPGVWVTCVKGKERQVIGELYDLFESISEDLWPEEGQPSSPKRNDETSLEDEIEKELKAIKRPRKEQRFASCQTDTQCLLFISCKPPVDPVKLVIEHVLAVRSSGNTRTKNALRFIPVSETCAASLNEISRLCTKIFTQFLNANTQKSTYTYKIELSIRNHNTLNRDTLLRAIAECVPEPHKVDLKNPEAFILVDIFKAVCGISVVTNYYELKKFNIQELAKESRDNQSD